MQRRVCAGLPDGRGLGSVGSSPRWSVCSPAAGPQGFSILLKNVEPVGHSLYHYEAIIHLLRVGVKLAGGRVRKVC